MGCGGSKGADDGPETNVPEKQGQLEAEKDAAAAEIQKAALGYKAKKDQQNLEKAKDEAAAEIQKGAALYMAKKKEKEAASAPEPSPLVGLQTAASQAVDAIVQLSHRLLGGDNAKDAPKPEPIDEEADLNAAADRISQSAGQAYEQNEAEKAKAAAVIQKSQKKRSAKK